MDCLTRLLCYKRIYLVSWLLSQDVLQVTLRRKEQTVNSEDVPSAHLHAGCHTSFFYNYLGFCT
jgi:hypothetical protein